jgi:hypothetical protein
MKKSFMKKTRVTAGIPTQDTPKTQTIQRRVFRGISNSEKTTSYSKK